MASWRLPPHIADAARMQELAQLVVNGLTTGSVIAITAVGLSLVYGILKIVNFAHGEYLTLGAYVAFVLNVGFGVPIVTAALGAMLVVGAVSVVLELTMWRPMRAKGAGLISMFIFSIGLALVMRHLVFLGWGARTRRYDVDVFQVYDLRLVRLSLSAIVVTAIAFTAIVGIGLVLQFTRMGKAMRAVSDNAALAAVSGVDVNRVVAFTWLLAGCLAGLGGFLQALLQASFNPNLGFTMLLSIFAAVILGGVGSAYGALAGGLVLGLAMELSTWSVLGGGLPGVYKPVVAFVVLIAALLVRPQGVFGKARIL